MQNVYVTIIGNRLAVATKDTIAAEQFKQMIESTAYAYINNAREFGEFRKSIQAHLAYVLLDQI